MIRQIRIISCKYQTISLLTLDASRFQQYLNSPCKKTFERLLNGLKIVMASQYFSQNPRGYVRIAISGSHGAGKTTLIDTVLKRRTDWHGLSESTRSLVPALGYASPYEIVEQNGIAMYEAMIIASWSFLRTYT